MSIKRLKNNKLLELIDSAISSFIETHQYAGIGMDLFDNKTCSMTPTTMLIVSQADGDAIMGLLRLLHSDNVDLKNEIIEIIKRLKTEYIISPDGDKKRDPLDNNQNNRDPS